MYIHICYFYYGNKLSYSFKYLIWTFYGTSVALLKKQLKYAEAYMRQQNLCSFYSTLWQNIVKQQM